MLLSRARRRGFSLLELMAVTAVLGVVAAIVVSRLSAGSTASKRGACETQQGNIEVQAEIWRHNTGAWPAADLANIGGNVGYFPAGVPTCPVEGTAYTIDSAGRVVGHAH